MLCSFILNLLLCCHSGNIEPDKNTIEGSDTATHDAMTNGINQNDEVMPSADSAFYIDLDKTNTSKTITGQLEGTNHPLKFFINVESGDTLKAMLQPLDANANIRINQVIYPDGTADGPFGRDKKFEIKKSGTCQLIIGNDLMAEGNTKTAFKLTVSK